MTSAQNPYHRVAQTLQYCLDATLQTMYKQKHTQVTVHVSAPIMLASVYMSYAMQFLQARTTVGMTSSTAPSVLASVSLSAHISDLMQATLDAIAAQASANRVELFMSSASTFLLMTTRSYGTHAPRFVENADYDEDVPWYPSSSYPIAALSLLIHTFSCLVHNTAQDSRVMVEPQLGTQANQISVNAYFDASMPVDEATWPPWLGPYVDLQAVLDDFGFELSQMPLSRTDMEQNEKLASFSDAKHPTRLSITLGRPLGADLLTSEASSDRDAPMIAPGITMISVLPMLQRHRVYMPFPDMALCRQLREYLEDWECTLVGMHERPDLAIVCHDTQEVHTITKARIPCIFISTLPRIASTLAEPLPRSTVPITEPVSRGRLALAFYHIVCKGDKQKEVSEHLLATESHSDIHALTLEAMASHLATVSTRQQVSLPSVALMSPTSPSVQGGASIMPTLDTRTPPLAQASPHVHSVGPQKIDALAPSSDYFTQAVSRLASQANIAGGRLVHGADGRPAGLYFQPRESSASQNSKAGSINPASDARRPHIQTRRSDKTGRSTSTPAPPTPSYPTASMLRAAQSHLPSVKGSASAVHVPQLPTTLSFSQRDSMSRPNAPTSIQLPPRNFDPKTQPSRPTPFAHLPSRSVRTSAQPQEGVVIGKRGEARRASNEVSLSPSALGAVSSPAYTPLLSPHSVSRIQKRKMALREEFLPPVNVLVVEDNMVNQRILSTFMMRKKIQYDLARDGREAVEKWRRGHFHLILMDIQLPVMDGIAATKEIRRLENLDQQAENTDEGGDAPMQLARHSVIIVALTASVHTKDRVEALAAGCNDFLNKPVNLPWLQRKILEWGSMQYLLHAGLTPGPSTTDCEQQTARYAPKSLWTQADMKAYSVARHLHLPKRLPSSTEDSDDDNDGKFSLPPPQHASP